MAKIINFLIYHYVPSLELNSVFLALFAVSALFHSYQAYRCRFYVFYPTLVLGALIEVAGYSGRVWSSQQVYVLTPFLLQTVLLVMAPVYFSAFVYIVLGMAINRMGQQYSVLTPRMYFITFVLADLISLILQAIGGGQAASGAATSAPTQSATNIMVAGIIFQLVTMAVFMGFGLDFAIRVSRDRPWAFRLRQMAPNTSTLVESPGLSEVASPGSVEKAVVELDQQDWRKWKLITIAVTISSFMIVLRGIFRAIELSQGWGGYIVSKEIYQAVLDGIPMVIAVGIFNFIHPGLLLGRKPSWRGYY